MTGTHRWRVIAPVILAAIGCAKGGAPSVPADGHSGAAADASGGADASNVDASCGDLCDSDKDGVPDPIDQCPNTPAGEPVNPVGCADSQLTPVLQTTFPPYGLTWTPNGDLGRAGGLTWAYADIDRSDLFHIWWVVCDDPATPCGVSLAGSAVSAGEGWQLDGSDSNLAGGTLVETNATQILLADGTMPALTGRLTLSVVDGQGAPVPVATVATLGVPARLGQYGAEITGTAYTVQAIIEVQAAGDTTWTPYLDYYDAQPTPMGSGSTAVSFGGSFWDK